MKGRRGKEGEGGEGEGGEGEGGEGELWRWSWEERVSDNGQGQRYR